MMPEKIMKSEQALEKGRIQASARKVGIRASTKKVKSERVPER